jgi:hypothetical protein
VPLGSMVERVAGGVRPTLIAPFRAALHSRWPARTCWLVGPGPAGRWGQDRARTAHSHPGCCAGQEHLLPFLVRHQMNPPQQLRPAGCPTPSVASASEWPPGLPCGLPCIPPSGCSFGVSLTCWWSKHCLLGIRILPRACRNEKCAVYSAQCGGPLCCVSSMML